MKKLSITLAALACLCVVAGCTTFGTNFSSEGVKKLSIGSTTEKEIIDAFGAPFKRQTRFENNIQYQVLSYIYGQGMATGNQFRQLDLEFRNGVLNAYVFNSQLKEDSTDFDIDAVSKLSKKPLTLSEVVSVMGHYNGEVRFPSILLKKSFGILPEAVPPQEASNAVIYLYAKQEREGNLLNLRLKLCIVYLTSDGSVVETRYFKGTL